MRSSLHKDEEKIAAALQNLIAEDETKKTLLDLEGDDAEAVLTLIHDVSPTMAMYYACSWMYFSDD